jgi:hypothetical protein
LVSAGIPWFDVPHLLHTWDDTPMRRRLSTTDRDEPATDERSLRVGP